MGIKKEGWERTVAMEVWFASINPETLCPVLTYGDLRDKTT